MYNFIDTNEVSGGYVLPAEAMLFNGEYIENQISGYRTLNVTGREALSPELTTYETGARDGARLHAKRFPARTIVVTYQLIAESPEAFRDAYNKLGKILNVEDARMIFNDEQDKYFVGTPSAIGEVDPGTNAVVGQIEILCVDPLKYSVVEYEATPGLAENTILIDYNGTYKAFPVLEANFYAESEVEDDGETAGALTGNGDCGFVAFFTADEKIIQLGDPDEVDGTNIEAKSQTLLNQLFHKSTCWGTATQALLSHNSGDVMPESVQQMGSLEMGVASYAAPSSPAPTSGQLANVWSDSGEPKFLYTVSAKTSNRQAASVSVTATITTALKYDGSYFGRGYGLEASLYVGGAWHSVTLKTSSEYWRGRTGHTKNITFTVTGLSAETAALTGIKFKVERTDTYGGAAGILAEKTCNNLPISQYTENVPETYFLTPASYGAASGAWHGPTITKTLPADSSGEVGAAEFTATQGIRMGIGNTSGDARQMGAVQVQICDASGNHIAGFRIYKNKVGTTGTCNYFVNGAKVLESGFDLAYNNEVFGASAGGGVATIAKIGNTVTFTVGNYKKVFVDDAITDMKAVRITYGMEQYSANAALAYNGLQWIKFVKNNCNTFKDIPNKFSANDVLTADCGSGDIYLNGNLAPELGALGNDWEGFCLTPGLNQIGFAYSDWLTSGYAPEIKVRYREAFL